MADAPTSKLKRALLAEYDELMDTLTRFDTHVWTVCYRGGRDEYVAVEDDAQESVLAFLKARATALRDRILADDSAMAATARYARVRQLIEHLRSDWSLDKPHPQGGRINAGDEQEDVIEALEDYAALLAAKSE